MNVEMRKYEEDYAAGCQSENECHQLIEQFVGEPLKMTGSRYATFDYENETTLAELKTRKDTSSAKYPSALVGSNKYTAGLVCDKDVYFFFRFSDGVFCYKQDSTDKFRTLKMGNVNRDRYTRKSECHLIPISKLTFVGKIEAPQNIVRFD